MPKSKKAKGHAADKAMAKEDRKALVAKLTEMEATIGAIRRLVKVLLKELAEITVPLDVAIATATGKERKTKAHHDWEDLLDALVGFGNYLDGAEEELTNAAGIMAKAIKYAEGW